MKVLILAFLSTIVPLDLISAEDLPPKIKVLLTKRQFAHQEIDTRFLAELRKLGRNYHAKGNLKLPDIEGTWKLHNAYQKNTRPNLCKK